MQILGYPHHIQEGTIIYSTLYEPHILIKGNYKKRHKMSLFLHFYIIKLSLIKTQSLICRTVEDTC